MRQHWSIQAHSSHIAHLSVDYESFLEISVVSFLCQRANTVHQLKKVIAITLKPPVGTHGSGWFGKSKRANIFAPARTKWKILNNKYSSQDCQVGERIKPCIHGWPWLAATILRISHNSGRAFKLPARTIEHHKKLGSIIVVGPGKLCPNQWHPTDVFVEGSAVTVSDLRKYRDVLSY